MYRTGWLCLVIFALSGCASLLKDPEQNWYRVSNDGPISAWAICVNEQSHKWLDKSAKDVDRNRLNLTESEVAPDIRLFAEVIADCRSHMQAAGWNGLSAGQKTEILADAFRQFKRIELNIITAEQSPVT
jgi:hypothetical protein